MNLLNSFKEYLFSQEVKPAPVTVKNYLSDINHFVKWFENQNRSSFNPIEISSGIINHYKNANEQSLSASSMQRHLSSLRKFFNFLKIEGIISISPFEPSVISHQPLDSWKLKEFKDHLYNYNAAHLTIKNYIIDINQFIAWAKQVTGIEGELLTKRINAEFIEEYKSRLLNNAGYSPATINRKLSSLRRYFTWASDQGMLENKDISVENIENAKAKLYIPSSTELEIENWKLKIPNTKYSAFPPLRLFQKVSNATTLALDSTLIVPLAKAAERVQDVIWRLKGQPIFEKGPATLSTKNITPQDLLGIKNISKQIYAPFDISTKSFSPFKKALFHLRHSRPKWYQTYHSYAITHYFHFAVLVIFLATLGFGIYNSFFVKAGQNPIFATTPPVAPPRILSFQGRLTDNNDNPITANTNVRFAIYDTLAASGSSLLWQEVDPVTPDTDGIFNSILGNVSAIPSTLFSQNASLYLGVTIETTPELTPRQQLATVAFAANSETLQGLFPITNSGGATTNVVLALDSSGNLTIGGSANPVFSATGGQFKLSGQPLLLTTNLGSNGNVQVVPDGTGQIDLQKGLVNTSISNNISTAKGSVEVDDLFSVLATSSGQSAFTLNQTSTGPLISASGSGVAKFTIGNDGSGYFAGNVGIANSSPVQRLEVAGNAKLTGYVNVDTADTGTQGLLFGSAADTNLYRSAANTLKTDDNFTAAGSNITFSTFTSNGGVLYTNGSGVLAQVTAGASTDCLIGGTTPSFSSCASAASSSIFWNQSLGALYPKNSTVDLLIGGQSTASAKFAVTNINGTRGTQVATLSGDLVLDKAASIQTTNGQTLTLGGTTSGLVNINNKAGSAFTTFDTVNSKVGIGTAAPGANLDINGGTFAPVTTTSFKVQNISFTNSTGNIAGTNSIIGLNIAPSVALDDFDASGTTENYGINVTAISGSINFWWNVNNYGIRIGNQGIASRDTVTAYGLYVDNQTGANNNYAAIFAGGKIGMGTTAPTSALHLTRPLSQGALGKALAIFDQIENQDIFTASKSGVAKFSITSAGGIKLGTNEGSVNDCLLSGGSGAAASFGSCATAVASSIFWNQSNGALYPKNSTVDLLIGGQSTTSALFAFTGMSNLAHQTQASISGQLIVMPNNGYSGMVGIGTTNPGARLQVTAASGTTNPLLLTTADYALSTGSVFIANFGASSGNTYTFLGALSSGGLAWNDLILNGNSTGGGKVGIGTVSPTSELYVTRPLSFGATGKALAVFDQIENQDIFTASAAGTNRFSVANTGVTTINGGRIILSGSINDGSGTERYIGGGSSSHISMNVPTGSSYYFAVNNVEKVRFDGAGAIYVSGAAGSNGNCLVSGGAGAAVSWSACAATSNIDTFWNQTNGALYANNSTVDLLVGGQATTSAVFAFTGMSSLTHQTQASFSGNLIVMPNNGFGGNVGIGTTTPNQVLDVRGRQADIGTNAVALGYSATGYPGVAYNVNYQTGVNIYNYKNNDTAYMMHLGGPTGNRISFDVAASGTSGNAISWTEAMSILNTGNVGLGTTAPTSELHVTRPLSFGATGKALAIFDQIENQDIFTASASGTPIFTVTRAGGIALGTNGLTYGTSAQCLLGGATASWGSCSTGITNDNFWSQTAGALYPNNSTVDFLVGGQSTASAKFKVLNIAAGTPTASISANSGNIATYLTGLGQLSTTNRQTLTIGNSSTNNTTGDLFINPNGTGSVLIGSTTFPGTNKFAVVETKTDTSGFLESQYNKLDANPGGASSATYVGLRTLARTTNGNGQTFTGTVVGLYNQAQHRGTGTLSNAYGVQGIVGTDNTGTITNANAFYALGQSTTTTGVMTTYTGFYSAAPTVAGGATIGTTYGLNIEAMTTGGTADYGARIDAADTATLWLSGNADNTTAAAGIVFGLSKDTNLYRSAANTLKTDDAFNVGGNVNISAAGAITGVTGLTLASGAINLGASNGTTAQCLLGGTTASWGSCSASSTTEAFWGQTLGALYPNNSTVDFLVGGQSTTSAKFAFTGMSSLTNQTQASISGQLIVMPNNGYSGRMGIGITSPSTQLNIYRNDTDTGAQLRIDQAGTGDASMIMALTGVSSYMFGIDNSDSDKFKIDFGSAGVGSNTLFTMDTSGNVGIGDTSPSKMFVVGNGDLFQVDSSGNALAPTLALGTATIAPTNTILSINSSTALTNTNNFTATISRTLTGTLTANLSSYGIYAPLTINATDGQFGHNVFGQFLPVTLSNGNTVDIMQAGRFDVGNSSTTLAADTGITATTSAAIAGLAHNDGAGSVITTQEGGDLQSYNNSTGTITAAVGSRNWAYTNLDAGVITTAYGTLGQSFENVTHATGGITTGYGGYFSSQDANTSYGLYAIGFQNSANSETFTNTYGIQSQCQDNSATVTITNCYGIYSQVLGTAGTITNGYGLNIANPTTTGTLTTNYGILVADQTGGDTSDYGIAIAGADTQALWIGSGADNTDAANGIAFGLSLDTNLYRSAANTLKTDDSLTVAGSNITFSTFTSNGGVLFTNGSGLLAQATAGTSAQCLLGGTTPSFGSCSASSTTDAFWSQGNGALYPNNSKVDLLIGGQATTSAVFAFTGMSSLTHQTQASISGQLIVMPNNGYSGMVGIGQTTPIALLHVQKDQNAQTIAAILENDNTSSGAYVEMHIKNTSVATDAFRLMTMGTGWTTTGGFVQDAAVLDTESGLSGGLSLMTRANAPIRFYTNGHTNERMRIAEDGNVGIGTTAPAATLEIDESSITTTYPLLLSNPIGGTNIASVGASFSAHGRTFAQIVGGQQTDGTYANGTLAFYTEVSNAMPTSPQMLIQGSTGNVGIGDTNPDSKLDVAGDLIVGDEGSTTEYGITFQNSTVTGASTNGWARIKTAGTTDGRLQFFTNLTGTGLTEKMSILRAGQIGLGTTAPISELHVTRPLAAGATGKALAVFDQIENQDIFTASAAGTTRFSLGLLGNATQSAVVTTQNAYTLNANSLSTGTGFALNSTSTSLSTGGLMSLYWNPSSATTATGDLLSLDIGANGILGNIFNVKDNGSTVFSVSQTAVTSNLPTAFTAPGDVSIAYDINFTNPTASYIKSAAPLYITAGETFNSSDLTLDTYNKGNIIADTEAFSVTGSATVSASLTVGTVTGNKILPGVDNLISLGATSTARFKDLFLGPSSLHVQCIVGDGCSQGADYDIGVNTASNDFTVKVNNTTQLSLSNGGGFSTRSMKDLDNSSYFLDPAASGTSLSTAGSIGIGTTNPGAKLDIPRSGNDVARIGNLTLGYSGTHYDEIGYNVDFTGTNNTYTYKGTDTAASIRLGYGNGSGGFEFMTAPSGTAGNALTLSTKMVILDSGNVGIGTTGPIEPLQVHLGANSNIGFFNSTYATVGVFNDVFNAWGNMQIGVGMYELSSGNVGIGITAPVGKLQVAGAALTNPVWQDANDRPSISATGNYPQLFLFAGGTANASHGPTILLGSYDAGTSGAAKHWSIGTAGNGASFLDIGYSAADLNPHSGIRNYNGTTMMTLLNTGNVGIGNTNPVTALAVSGNIGATGYVGAGCEANCETSGGYSLLYADGHAVLTDYLEAAGGLRQDGNVILNGTDTWLRTTAATGWYNSTYAVGWYATQAGRVDTYNNAGIYAAGSITTGGAFSGAGTSLTGTAASLTAGSLTTFTPGGLTEIGRYLDFHGGTGADTDYTIRLYSDISNGVTQAGALTIAANGGVVLTGPLSGGNITTSGYVSITAAADGSGNLRFSAANPYISASSYIVMPGGLYVSAGTLYAQNQLQARGGVNNDGGTLSLSASNNLVQTTSTFRVGGVIDCIGGYCPTNNAVRLTPNLHLNSNAGNAVIINWDNGTTGTSQTLRIGNGASADAAYFRADGYMFAPYWGDINNGSYYVDPNSTSNMYYVSRERGYGATEYDINDTQYYVDPNNVSISNDIRSQIWYDYNNTGYYVDGNNTSNLLHLTTNGTVIMHGLPAVTDNKYVCADDAANADKLRFKATACTQSSRKLKENIVDLGYGLDEIMRLQPRFFNFKNWKYDPGDSVTKRRVGFIAEEVNEVVPEFINYGENDLPAGVDYPMITSLLTKGIQQQQLEIMDSRKRIASIEAELSFNNNGNLSIIDNTIATDSGYLIPHFFTLNDALGNPISRIGAFSEIVSAKIRVGLLEAQQVTTYALHATIASINELTTDSLTIATANVSIAGQSLNSYIAGIVNNILSSRLQGLALEAQEIISPIASIDALHTNLISPLAEDSHISVKLDDTKFQILNTKYSTGSAVASFDNQGNASLSGQLLASSVSAKDATFSGTLRAGRIIADQIEGLNISAATVSANYITNNYYSDPFPTLSASPAANYPLPPTPYTLGSGYISIASFSSQLAYVENLSSANATFSQGLTVYGSTTLSDTSIVGQLAVGGSLILADNSINVLGADLKLQPLRQGGISIMAGLIYIDTNGNAKFGKDVTVDGTLYANTISPKAGKDLILELGSTNQESSGLPHNSSFIIHDSSHSGVFSVNNLGDIVASGAATIAKLNLNNIVSPALAVSPTEVIATGSAGTGKINAGRSEMTINNPLVTEKSLIYITPSSNTNNQVLYLLRQVSGESFTVGIQNPSAATIPFNWIIVN